MAPLLNTTLRSRFTLFRGKYCGVLILLSALIINFLFVNGHDLQRCVEVVALAMIAITCLVRMRSVDNFVMPVSTGTLFLSFFILGLFSIIQAISQRHAIFEWSILLLLFVTLFTIAAEIGHNEHRLFILLQWIGVAGGLYSLRVLILYAASMASGLQPDWSVITVGFSNLRHLNHTQTPLLPLIVLLVLKTPKEGKQRKMWFVLASFWWALLFVTEARASILALTLACATALVLRRVHARKFIATMVLTALGGAFLYALLFMLLPVFVGLAPIGTPLNVIARTAANPSSNRNILWTYAFELIKAHPFFGVGPQHFAHEAASLNTGAHPHNWMLQIAAEWGIPAFLCLLGTVIIGARGLIRSSARIPDTDIANQQMLVALQVVCTATLVDGFFSGVIVMPQSQLAIALVLGIAFAWTRLQKGLELQPASTSSIVARAIMGTMVVAGLCGMIWSVAPDFVRHARDERLTPAEATANPVMYYWPRMWKAGYF